MRIAPGRSNLGPEIAPLTKTAEIGNCSAEGTDTGTPYLYALAAQRRSRCSLAKDEAANRGPLSTEPPTSSLPLATVRWRGFCRVPRS